MELKEKDGEGEEDKQIDTNVKKDDDTKSHQALFDQLQAKEDDELSEAASSVLSSNSFRSVSTRKIKPSLLN